jgi:alpha-beta hydrolase superfamily lysophospholipase
LRFVAPLIAIVAAALVWAGSASALAFSKVDTAITMDDGVDLAATVYTPNGAPPTGGWPAVMLLHGLGQTREPMNLLAETYLATEGYVVLTFDARGLGASGGLVSLDGPREIQDVRNLFDWLVSHRQVARTRVGAIGFSYGGGAVWRATAEGVPFAAIVPVATWTDLYGALVPQNLTKGGAFASMLSPVPVSHQSQDLQTSAADFFASTNLPEIRTMSADRSSVAALARLKTPVFMVQGRRDFAFGIEQATDAYTRLRGPKRLYLGDLGHAPATNPVGEVGVYMTEARLWLDRYLKGIPNGFDYTQPIEIAPDPWTGRTVKYWKFPARKIVKLAFPGAATIESEGKVVRTVRQRLPKTETLGAPLVRVQVSSPNAWPHLVAVLTALTRDGRTIVVSDGGIQALVGPVPQTLTIRLVNDATAIPKGARLQLTLAATSTAQDPANGLYVATVPDGSQLTVGRVDLTVPVLRTPISR